MPVCFLSNEQFENYGHYTGALTTDDLAATISQFFSGVHSSFF